MISSWNTIFIKKLKISCCHIVSVLIVNFWLEEFWFSLWCFHIVSHCFVSSDYLISENYHLGNSGNLNKMGDGKIHKGLLSFIIFFLLSSPRYPRSLQVQLLWWIRHSEARVYISLIMKKSWKFLFVDKI